MSNGYVKRIVCLANSRKPPSGRCVAGREVLARGYGNWIRPVSVRPSAEISLEERRYENGREPKLLDIIDIQMIAAAPHVHQTENHIIDAGYYWTKTGELAWGDLSALVETPSSLWRNGDSTRNGINDRINQALISEFTNSLYLIEPETLTVRVQTEGTEFGNPRRRVRADFRYLGTHYNFIVTDPLTEGVFLAQSNGNYPLKDVYLCISLTEVFERDSSCHKLVAAIISEQPL